MKRECPHPECTRRISPGLFACKQHWRQLHPSLRSRIWRNYRSGNVESVPVLEEVARKWWEAYESPGADQ